MGRTWDYLPELGFESKAELEGHTPKKTYDFGTFILEAYDTMGKYFRQVVACGGSYANQRSVAVIDFELPEYLDSKEQCAAVIYYYLRHHDVLFEPDWWESAAESEHLLPWGKKEVKEAHPPEITAINIKVLCSECDRGDGAWWNIIDVVNESDGSHLGDCGVYEFDAEKGFSAKLEEGVLSILGELGSIDSDKEYFVEIKLMAGSIELGQSFQRFSKSSTMHWPMTTR